MKKTKKSLLIIAIVLLGIVYILINKVLAETIIEITANKLYTTSNILCIAKGYPVASVKGGKSEYKLEHTIEISDGDVATCNGKKITNKANAKIALIAYYASHKDIDKTGENISGNPADESGLYWESYSQNAIWEYWKTWYDAVGKKLEINKRYNKDSSPIDKKAAKTLLAKGDAYYENLKSDATIKIKKGKNCTTTIAKDEKTNRYYIGPFKITASNRVKEITKIETDDQYYAGWATSPNGKIQTQGSPGKNKDFYIILKSNAAGSGENITINVTYTITAYEATLELYKKQNAKKTYQNILVVDAKEVDFEKTREYTWKNQDKDFSLQKYIVAVGNKFEDDTLSEISYGYEGKTRRSEMAISDDKQIFNENNKAYQDNKTNEGKVDPIDYHPNKDGDLENKHDAPVQIKTGDYVVYKIEVFNNLAGDAKTAYIRDRINQEMGAKLIGIYDSHEGLKFTKPLKRITEGKPNTEQYLWYEPGNDGEKYDRYSWKTEITGNSYNSFWVVVQYTKPFRGIVSNKAYIMGNEASDTYRIEDFDYVKMATSNVSLQKYIVQVNDTDLNSSNTDITNRKNKNANEESIKEIAKNETASDSDYKDDNPVSIEAGDTVKYAITIYNNGSQKENVTVTDYIPEYATEYWWEGEEHNTKSSNDDEKEGIKTVELDPGQNTTIYMYVKYGEYINDMVGNISENGATITDTENENETEYRTTDFDYTKMKPYKVSLQKIVYSVNGNTQGMTSFDRWNSWESNANIHNNPADETYNRNNLYAKHNNPVTVSNGDYVTYAIRVKNDGETKVSINKVKDILPDGLSEYKIGDYNSSGEYESIPNDRILYMDNNGLLNPEETKTLYVTAKVSESNMSTRVLRNYAEIVESDLKNKNNVSVTDTTPNNNQDADYIQLKDITIAGTVWNDKALDKKQDNYNGVYDESQENKLPEVKVQLYRQGKVISEKYTNAEGKYSFSADDINKFYEPNNEKYETKNIVTEQCERHIKAPYTCTDNAYTGNVSHGANYWKENNPYTYYIVFEYDGITYTNTIMGDINAENYQINSNAREDEEKRQDFNNRFSKVDNTGASKLDGSEKTSIAYDTKNENGYIPQSNHIYNPETMAMQSSTNQINIGSGVTEDQLQHINLGLKGRDIFDLELTSDVYSTKVTVNGQTGTYNYNNNKVTVRKSDIAVAEDMANFASETREGNISEIEQKIRNTDIDKTKTNSNYNQTGLGIEVTYKITVTNASRTQGTASKIVNYYDSKYTFQKAYIGNQELDTAEGTKGSGYASRIITTPEAKLNQGDTIDIYVVYTLKAPTTTLASLLKGTKTIPTYNMAEIYEYTTQCASGQTEYTRGLIDKDSAPGSANKEQVRTKDTEGQNTATVNGNPTTVQYYFGGNDLTKLKYEDDTYAAPTLYFTSDANGRKLSGVVFKDNTTTDNETRIKTGNGIKDDGESGVYGATVELVELNEHNQPEKIANNEGTVRYTTTTNKDGYYLFENFLPGKYVVRYHYGDTTKTVLLNQLENEVNKYSFNGEDYQSTNNIGAYGARKLNDSVNNWYAFNKEEGVSTGTDNTARRKEVSKIVTDYADDKMAVLNNVRNGTDVSKEEVDTLIKDTNMYATTPNFTLTVEETVKDGNQTKQNNMFTNYEVTNMNFGIAEVPVTIIDLQKHVNSFTITASDGTNIASLAKQDGKWKTKGNILPAENLFDVSIEDEKLQGARLEVTYDVSANIIVEKNYDGKEATKATITGLVDYIDNDLSYSETLGQNSSYWDVTNYEETQKMFKKSEFKDSKGNIRERKGKIDAEGNKYTNIVKAKSNSPLLQSSGGSVPITLEKTLSATDSSIEDIVTSSINTYEYDNNIEITNIKYENTETDATGDNFVFRDRVRIPSKYIILAGLQYDDATSETITIHPPTGENNNITLYVIALISLGVLAISTVGIKKFVINKK